MKTEQKPLVSTLTVETIPGKLAKQIQVPTLTSQDYRDIVSAINDRKLEPIGWAKGEAVFKDYDAWYLLLVQWNGSYMWVLYDRGHGVPKCKQLFIA